jgi:hypothetical protein
MKILVPSALSDLGIKARKPTWSARDLDAKLVRVPRSPRDQASKVS